MNDKASFFNADFIGQMSQHFSSSGHALFGEMAIEVSRFEAPEIEFLMPFNPNFVSDAKTGTYSPGVYTILMDSVLGIGSLVAIGTPVPVATLSLSVDYVAPNQAAEALRAVGWADALTDDIAYASGNLYGADSGTLLARANGAFAINTKGPSFGEGLLQKLANGGTE